MAKIKWWPFSATTDLLVDVAMAVYIKYDGYRPGFHLLMQKLQKPCIPMTLCDYVFSFVNFIERQPPHMRDDVS